MDPQLKALLEPHMRPVEPSGQQTYEQAVNSKATMLAYLARTFLDWDGPLPHEEIAALIRQHQ